MLKVKLLFKHKLLGGCISICEEDPFIGWKSKDGKLEVIGIAGKKGSHKVYKVTCTECSKDPELFPDGYFISTKGHLKEEKKPCGCSKAPKWKQFQLLILAKRSGELKGFIVLGFDGDNKSKFKLRCIKDGHEWSASTMSVIHGNRACPVCGAATKARKRTLPYEKAVSNCETICKEVGYEPIGFIDGYTTARYSFFYYRCPEHGLNSMVYYSFVNRGSRCPGCAKSGYDPNKAGSFYIVNWYHSESSFIKFGITNQDIMKRVSQQKSGTLYNPEILYCKTFENGYIPRDIEKYVKSTELLKIGVIAPLHFPDGFTETIETKDLPVLEELVKSKLHNLEDNFYELPR